MIVFVAGGTGFVGGHLRAALLHAGHTVRLLVHDRKESYGKGVEAVEGDVTRPESFTNAMSGCDAVVNLVGIIREFPSRGVTFERLHVQATRMIVDAAQKTGVRRYLHMSALGSRYDAISAYHRSKWTAEELVRSSGLRWTIFRPSIIFGPKDDFINLLAGYIRSFPAVPVIGDGLYSLQPIAAADVAGCFVKSLTMPEAEHREFELCGADRVNYCELLNLIGEMLGKKPVRKIHNPVWVMKLIVPVLQRFSFFPITMDQIQMLLEGNVCNGEWQAVFGFEATRLRKGIGAYLTSANQ